MESEVGLLRRQLAVPRTRPRRRGDAVALAKLVGRVEWVAGNAALSGAAAPSWRSPGPCDGRDGGRDASALRRPHLRRDRAPGRTTRTWSGRAGIQPASGPADRLRGRLRGVQPDRLRRPTAKHGRPGRASRRGRAPRSGKPRSTGGIASSLDPSFEARALGVATAMVADATLEAAGVAGRRRSATRRDRGPATAIWQPARLASVLPLGVVPQRGTRQCRAGPGRDGGRGHRRGARVLGRAGHPVGAAIERPGHRRHGRARRRRHRSGVRRGLGHHDRGGGHTVACCGCCCPSPCWCRGWPRR